MVPSGAMKNGVIRMPRAALLCPPWEPEDACEAAAPTDEVTRGRGARSVRGAAGEEPSAAAGSVGCGRRD